MLKKNAFENMAGNGENDSKQPFLNNVFALSKSFTLFVLLSYLLSADAFNLEESKLFCLIKDWE